MNWNAPGITEGESGLLSLPRGGHADGRTEGRKEREEVECQSVNRWMIEEVHVRIWRTMRADGPVNETKGVEGCDPDEDEGAMALLGSSTKCKLTRK